MLSPAEATILLAHVFEGDPADAQFIRRFHGRIIETSRTGSLAFRSRAGGPGPWHVVNQSTDHGETLYELENDALPWRGEPLRRWFSAAMIREHLE